MYCKVSKNVLFTLVCASPQRTPESYRNMEVCYRRSTAVVHQARAHCAWDAQQAGSEPGGFRPRRGTAPTRHRSRQRSSSRP